MAKGKKRERSPGWERTLRDNPQFVRETIRSLTDRAAAGDAGAADQLVRWLTAHPEHKPAVEAAADLTARAERVWAALAADGDRLAEQAAQAEAEALRTELLPPDAGVVERVLVGAVVVARLVHHHAATMAAHGSAASAVVAARDRRLTAAQNRLFAAVKGWQAVAGKKARGVRPTLKLLAVTPTAS